MQTHARVAPHVSVVIPTCNRLEWLAHALVALSPATQRVAPHLYEVIVSDDSTDESTRLMIADRFPSVRYVRGPRRGPAANRNRGASQARGEWVAFIDDDCRPAAGWLWALRQEVSQKRLDVVEGKTSTPDSPDSPLQHCVVNLTGGHFWSCNLAIRREVFAALGGFDEDFEEAGGEDLELAHRIRTSGVRTRFCPSVEVVHPSYAVPWTYLLRRTFLIRWHLLYQHKIGAAVRPDAPLWRALWRLTVERVLWLLRTTWRSLRHFDRRRPRSTAVTIALHWLTFPIVLPYLAYWELRFRRMLRDRPPRPPTRLASDAAHLT